MLEVCIGNCDISFARAIATRKWMNRLIKIAHSCLDVAVRMTIIQLLVDWRAQVRRCSLVSLFAL